MNKNGNFKTVLSETSAENILIGTSYTKDSPDVITGSGTDIVHTLTLYAEVEPGKTYYLSAECYPAWAPGHGSSSTNNGKGTIWLYVSKTYDPSSMGYDTPVCFTTSNQIADGIWKYTVPSGYHMIRIRTNTYSDGTNSVTTKFWNIEVAPEDKCADERIAAMKVADNSACVEEIVEM